MSQDEFYPMLKALNDQMPPLDTKETLRAQVQHWKTKYNDLLLLYNAQKKFEKEHKRKIRELQKLLGINRKK